MVTIAKLMLIPKLSKLKLVAGKEGVNRVVGCATVMEVPDVLRWVKDNAFIITSLYHVKDDVDDQCRVLENLAKSSCSGMAIRTGQYVKTLHPRFLMLADEYNFPIYEIPIDVTYIDIIVNMTNYIYEEQNPRIVFEKYIKDIIFDAYTDSQMMRERGHLLGYYIDSTHYVAMTFQITKTYSPTEAELKSFRECVKGIAQACASYPHIENGIAVEFQESTSIFLDFKDRSSINKILKYVELISTERLEKLFNQNFIKVGYGEINTGLDGIKSTYYTSLQSLQIGGLLYPAEFFYSFKDIAFQSMIIELVKGPKFQYFNSVITTIANEDLLNTLTTFFECNANIDKTAEKMYLHKNTVKYRIQRISELTALDFKNINDTLKLYMTAIAYRYKQQ